MKKLMTAFFAFAVIFSMSVLSSCGGHPSNEEVEKILDKEKADEKEYSKLISYYEAYFDEVTPLYKDLEKSREKGDDKKKSAIKEKIDKVRKKYEHHARVSFYLNYSSEDELGKSNAEKLKKINENLTINPLRD